MLEAEVSARACTVHAAGSPHVDTSANGRFEGQSGRNVPIPLWPTESAGRSPEPVIARIDRLQRHLEELGTRISHDREPPAQTPATTGGATAAAAAGPDVMGYDEIVNELVIYEKVLQVLSNETNKLQELMRRRNEYQQQQDASVQLLQDKLTGLEQSVTQNDGQLTDLTSRLTDLELTNYDGTLLWKIVDVNRRRRDAVSGANVSLQSPAFYTSRTGYKLYGRVYFNGEGVGKATHLSLFFVIARGNFDALLRWPFNQKVTMSLLDQAHNRQHVTEAFRPNHSSSAFQRPSATCEMNVATGFPKFLPLMSLDAGQNPYVRDDTIFVRIIVDCRDI